MADRGHSPVRGPQRPYRQTSLPESDPSAKLSESLTSLTLSAPQQQQQPTGRKHSPSPLLRRGSEDIRNARPDSASPGPESPRFLSRAPSTPTIRKRSSIASMQGSAAPPRTLSRKGSMLSICSEPPQLLPKKEGLPIQDLRAETTVILHDTSYKHRYSRPDTSRADLATIVERPERIPAAVLGISSAQIRLGKGKISIRKSVRMGGLLDPEVMLVHAHGHSGKGKSWPEELANMCGLAVEKLKKGECEIPKGFHQGDLYLCGESQEDLEGCLGAVYDAVDVVFGRTAEEHGARRAFACIRPPGHHCAEAQPSGFCWLNNVHIGIAHAAREHGLTHAVILDFDLHHGDGSQSIAWALNDISMANSAATKKTAGIKVPQIGYFSLHDINSYPCEYGDMEKIKNASLNLEAHGQVIQNIHLKSYATDEQFWQLYENLYSGLIFKARDFLLSAKVSKRKGGSEFKAGVFLSAGFDASEHESSGMQRHHVNVPTGFFARFSADAVRLADECCEGRVVSVLEGGYSDRALTSGVLAHIVGMAALPPSPMAFIQPSLGAPIPEHDEYEFHGGWDEDWWSLDRITELERYHQRMTGKKPIVEKNSSYLSATASSAAKKLETPRRVLSGSAPSSVPHGPVPQPIVPWEVAAWELSRKLIPEFPEEVEIPAIEKPGPKKRHSVAGVVDPAEGTKMILRDRKPKPILEVPMEDGRRRRQTTTGVVVDRPSSRAPSRATSRAPSRMTNPPNRGGGTPALPSPTRKVSSTGGGFGISGPRSTSVRTSSGSSAGSFAQRSPPVSPGLENTNPSSSSAKRAPSLSVSTVSTASTNGTKSSTEIDDAFVNKFQKVKITFKASKADTAAAAAAAKKEEDQRARQLQKMEREKEAIEKRLAIEKAKVAGRRKMISPPTTTTNTNATARNGAGRTASLTKPKTQPSAPQEALALNNKSSTTASSTPSPTPSSHHQMQPLHLGVAIGKTQESTKYEQHSFQDAAAGAAVEKHGEMDSGGMVYVSSPVEGEIETGL